MWEGVNTPQTWGELRPDKTLHFHCSSSIEDTGTGCICTGDGGALVRKGGRLKGQKSVDGGSLLGIMERFKW
ncbi:hypothetical protein EVAR_59413_1 [Eumeta japonica]|uniref:Uncharacterized protein n=1 Tax=Eumeta variegata TaxID=151549 RepID=A0A4C1YY47_EUMVA|nr:hypothetical protein EVAR_59413_1 [Eumeta japonica]